jgi:N-acyl-D-amino-acid deacylase
MYSRRLRRVAMNRNAKTFAELCALVGVIMLCFAPSDIAGEPTDVPVSGAAPPRELRPLDSSIKKLVSKWNVPGAAVAVMRGGRLIFARGYGYADLTEHKTIDPEHSMFRIASVSKPITAAATLRLVQDGKLNLDDKAFDILNDVQPAPGARADHRLNSITIRDLLNMSAGWDKERSGDPILQPYIGRAAKRLRLQGPADFDTTARYMLGRKLDFMPGTKFAYSNFTYGLLGKIIEKASGKPYQDYVRECLFEPSGVQLYQGHTRKEDRLPNEVVYYAPLEAKARSFLPTNRKHVEAPYARAYLETDLPMIGWVSTAPELATLMDHVLSDDRLLAPDIRDKMFARPALPCWQGRKRYFSMGWEVSSDASGHFSLFKDGTLPGTRAFVEHTPDGITWVALFNSRPPQKQPDRFALQIKQLMASTMDAIGGNRTAELRRRQPAYDCRKEIAHDAKLFRESMTCNW